MANKAELAKHNARKYITKGFIYRVHCSSCKDAIPMDAPRFAFGYKDKYISREFKLCPYCFKVANDLMMSETPEEYWKRVTLEVI